MFSNECSLKMPEEFIQLDNILIIEESNMKNRFWKLLKGLVTYFIGFCIGFILSLALYSYTYNVDWKKPFEYVSLNEKYVDIQNSTSDRNNLQYINIFHQEDTLNKQQLLCYLLVGPSTHSTAIHVKNTWGKRCDKLIFFSTEPDHNLQPIVLEAKEGYSYLWDKSQRAIEYLLKKHADYDWFLKADDDSFIIVENLKLFLSRFNSSDPVYYGVKFKMFVEQGYMSGGGGYVYSKEALRRIVSIGLQMTDTDLCPHDKSTGAEDLNIGKCFEAVGVRAGDSYDAEGKPRFFSHGPEALFYKTDLINRWHWYWKYLEHPHTLGPDCCSRHLVSFHEISPRMMWALEMLLYHVKVHNHQPLNYTTS